MKQGKIPGTKRYRKSLKKSLKKDKKIKIGKQSGEWVQEKMSQEKPQYNIWQTICFMIQLAWQKQKKVLTICLGLIGMELGISLAQLYLGPVILAKIEGKASLPELLGSIGMFALILFLMYGIRGYLGSNAMFGRIEVRQVLMIALNRKASMTSFPNTRDPKIIKMKQKAFQAVAGNSEATEHIWSTLTVLCVNIIGFVLYLLLLSGLQIGMVVVILVTTTGSFFISKHLNQWGYHHREEEATYQQQLYYIRSKAESVTLAKDIRVFGLGIWLKEVYQDITRLYEVFIDHRERATLWANVIEGMLSLVRNGLVYGYLIWQALTKQLSASDFLLYVTAVTGFTAWITGILNEYLTLHKESLVISLVREYLNLPEQFRFEGGEPIPELSQKKDRNWELSLENVSFRYSKKNGSEQESYLFQHLNLTVHAGEKLAVVGLNGAGKTTLVKLLCGLYDPEEGRVLLNGRDIRRFNRQEYYQLFSAVFQEYSLLDVTVAEAVAQKATKIDRERVMECLKQAGLSETIASFSKGLDTHMGRTVYLDGVELSGGETQRLLLARALYKDGPFLILDEPTAALDPIAENDIYQKYHDLTKEKTSVFISHRLASTRFCDRIIFLADGVIAEEGTHEELMKKNGGYAKLFEIQSRYYQKEKRH